MNKAFIYVSFYITFFMRSLAFAETTDSECVFPIADGTQSIRRLTLTEKVFHCIHRPGYQGLSIVNGKNKRVPFEIQLAAGETQQQNYQQELNFSVEPVPSSEKTADQIRRIAELSGVQSSSEMDSQWQLKNQYYSSILIEPEQTADRLQNLYLSLNTTDRSISSVLIVEVSNDREHWTTLLDPYHLYSLTGSDDPLQTFNLPIHPERYSGPTAPRFWRIAMLSNVADFAQSIEKIAGVFRQQQQHIQLQWLTVDRLHATDSNNQWLVNLPGLFPVSSIRLTPPAHVAFYQGSVRVLRHPQLDAPQQQHHNDGRSRVRSSQSRSLTTTSKPSWRWITNFTQYQLQQDQSTIRSGDITLNPIATKIWKLTFNQPDISSPEQLPTVELGWSPPRVVFLTQGPGPYRLLTGQSDIQPLPIPRSFYKPGDPAETVTLVYEYSADTEGVSPPATLTADIEAATEKQSSWVITLLWLLLCVGVVAAGVWMFRWSQAKHSKKRDL